MKDNSSAASGRDLAAVSAFVLLVALPFLGKPYHIDEPFYLAIARQVLRDPLHPLDFQFNWYGLALPMGQINNTPPLLWSLLAVAWKLTGGVEWRMRVFFLPFDLAAAWALYGIAARFLRRPFWPTLIVLAAPAYLINMGHLMTEKVVAGLAFPALYALVKGVDEGRPRWYWASALLCGCALLTKYVAVLFFLPVAGYSLHRGVPLRRILAYLCLACAGLGAYLLWDRLTGQAALGAAWRVASEASGRSWAGWPHNLRSVLAFAGGCGVATALWPWVLKRPKPWATAAVLAAAAVLFAPFLDRAPLVAPVDRLAGFVLSAGSLWGLCLLFASRSAAKGWALWAPWTLAVLIIMLGLYWSVLARLVLFMIPPFVYCLAELLEAEWAERPLRRLYAGSFAGILALSLALGGVDYAYARAQRRLAEGLAASHRAAGRKVRFAGQWGLKFYLEREGCEPLDYARGGWGEVRRGDIVIVPRVNSNVLRPSRLILANVTRLTVDHPIPLRLISGWTGEGGFYSNITGFLPFSISWEPLEEFEIIEAL